MCYTWYRVLILVPRVHVVYFSSLSQVVVCRDGGELCKYEQPIHLVSSTSIHGSVLLHNTSPSSLVSQAGPFLFHSTDRFQYKLSLTSACRILKAIGAVERKGSGLRNYVFRCSWLPAVPNWIWSPDQFFFFFCVRALQIGFLRALV